MHVKTQRRKSDTRVNHYHSTNLSSYYEATKIVRSRLKIEIVQIDIPPIVDTEDINGVEKEPDWSEGWFQCNSCKRWWSRKELLDYHKKKTVCGIHALGDEKEDI